MPIFKGEWVPNWECKDYSAGCFREGKCLFDCRRSDKTGWSKIDALEKHIRQLEQLLKIKSLTAIK